MSIQIDIPYDAIKDFCHRWKIKEFALFGSVLTEQFRPDSDIDVLITDAADAKWNLFDEVHMINELEDIFQRKVDLLHRPTVEKSSNLLRRKVILESVQIILAA